MGFAERDYERRPVSGKPPLPPVTKALLIVNIAVFILDIANRGQGNSFERPPFERLGAFNVMHGLLGGEVWRLITFQFLHDSLGHVFFNMVGVYFFAPWVERWWGSRRFLGYYLLCGVGGALFFTLLLAIGLLPNADVGLSNLVGASAGVFGLLFAIYRLAPAARVMLVFPPVTLTMRQLALIFAGLAMLTILGGVIFPRFPLFANSGGEAGHLGGGLMGLLLMRFPGILGKGSGHSRKVIRPREFRRRVGGKIRPRTEIDLKEESEVDRILEKVSREGLDSLTGEERRILNEAANRHS